MFSLIRFSSTMYAVYDHTTRTTTGTYSLQQVIYNFPNLVMTRPVSSLSDYIKFVCDINAKYKYSPTVYTADKLTYFAVLYPELFI